MVSQVVKYYIAVLQRNHLDIMTDAPVFCMEGTTYKDFSAGGSMGSDSQAEIAPGVFAMYCGDLNCDGVVDAGDRSAAWNERNKTGYLYEDANMDGVVDASERSITWNNRNKASSVPHN